MEELVYQIIGNRIRQYRERLGMTQEKLGETIGLTRTSVTNMEAGRQKFQVGTIYRICAAFHISPHELFPSLSEVEHEQKTMVPLPPEFKSYTAQELDWVTQIIQKGKQSGGDQ